MGGRVLAETKWMDSDGPHTYLGSQIFAGSRQRYDALSICNSYSYSASRLEHAELVAQILESRLGEGKGERKDKGQGEGKGEGYSINKADNVEIYQSPELRAKCSVWCRKKHLTDWQRSARATSSSRRSCAALCVVCDAMCPRLTRP